MWDFSAQTKSKHPAPFPEELPKRLIKLHSFEGDVVLDPFVGSGTTCKVAKDLGRNYIGIDKDDTFYNQSINNELRMNCFSVQILENIDQIYGPNFGSVEYLDLNLRKRNIKTFINKNITI